MLARIEVEVEVPEGAHAEYWSAQHLGAVAVVVTNVDLNTGTFMHGIIMGIKLPDVGAITPRGSRVTR